LCQILRLVFIYRTRSALFHGAEGAIPGADIAQKEECGSSLGKTVSLIGAEGALANGMEAQSIEKVFHAAEEPGVRHLLLEPWRESSCHEGLLSESIEPASI
jgi:hypothetical protein